MTHYIDDYIQFQKTCDSPFHVVETLKERLLQAKFQELSLQETWKLECGKHYFVIQPSEKALIAFQVGTKAPSKAGFAIIGAHTDSPVLRLKLSPFGDIENYNVLFSETHGGLILRSYLDRPLVLAGKVYSYERDSNGKPKNSDKGYPLITSKLVRTEKPIAVIPDLAIHLDRTKNTEGKINPETMMYALTGNKTDKDFVESFQSFLGTGSFDGFELNFAPLWEHSRVGLQGEFLVGPRHDDLVMVYTAQCAMEFLSKNTVSSKTSVAAFFDAEETGSQNSGGAASYFIRDVLKRIHHKHPESSPDSFLGESLSQSFLISADVSHGVHPGHPDKHDLKHRPLLNKGLVLKANSNDRYTSNGYGKALFKALCDASKQASQDFCVRGDLGCGSTIGPILSTQLGCESIDVGIALLGMHSSAETIGVHDIESTIRVFSQFYANT